MSEQIYVIELTAAQLGELRRLMAAGTGGRFDGIPVEHLELFEIVADAVASRVDG